MILLPKAQTENIAVQNLNDEVLIYNLTTNQAFCLNATTAKIFNACDGVTTFAALKEQHQLTDEIIYLALDLLKKENLLAGEYASPFAGMSRREVIKKVGLASVVALPVISAVIAPAAAHAASTVVCNSCTITFPFNTVQFPVAVGPGIGGFTTTGCNTDCTNCRCTIPGGQGSCNSTCTVA